MPFKFKNNDTIKIKHRWIYTLGAGFMIFMSLLDILFMKYNAQDFLNLGLAIFLLWGIWMNGLYKIMRKIAEWNIKRRDNSFDPYRK